MAALLYTSENIDLAILSYNLAVLRQEYSIISICPWDWKISIFIHQHVPDALFLRKFYIDFTTFATPLQVVFILQHKLAL